MNRLLLLLGLVVLSIVSSYADQNITSCGTVINSVDNYFLNQSINTSSGTCIEFQAGASGSTLNCQGFSINNTGGANYGLSISADTMIIENCSINYFDLGNVYAISDNLELFSVGSLGGSFQFGGDNILFRESYLVNSTIRLGANHDNISINNLILNGNGSTLSAIEFSGPTITNSHFENISIQNYSNFAIYSTSAVSFSYFKNINLQFNGDGITLNSVSSPQWRHNILDNLTVINNNAFGLRINFDFRNNTIRNSNIYNNSVYDMAFQGWTSAGYPRYNYFYNNTFGDISNISFSAISEPGADLENYFNLSTSGNIYLNTTSFLGTYCFYTNVCDSYATILNESQWNDLFTQSVSSVVSSSTASLFPLNSLFSIILTLAFLFFWS